MPLGDQLTKEEEEGGVSGRRTPHSQGHLSLQEETTIGNYAAGSEVNTRFPILSGVSPSLSPPRLPTSVTPCFFA